MTEFGAIARLAQQADFPALCSETLQQIRVLGGGVAAELLEAFDERGGVPGSFELDHWVVRRFTDGVEIDRPAWLARAAPKVPEGDVIPRVQTADPAGHVLCLGQLAGVWRFLVIEGRLTPVALRRIARLCAIFRHLLAMIDRFERDALTGLLNRQSFDYRFEELLERHRQNPRRARVGTMPWLAIADIDHFKRINDTYGHRYGDEILLLFSRLMHQNFRSDDLLFRYGGEEFVLVLPETDHGGAGVILERVREAIAGVRVADGQGRTVARTASIGGITLPPGHAAVSPVSAQWLVDLADQAMYAAKIAGKNRVTLEPVGAPPGA